MAYFPDVSAGDTFIPNALLSNNVRRLVNTLNGFHAKPMPGTCGMIRIPVYCESELEGGTAVNFAENGSFCGDAVPCEPLKDSAKPWGVVARHLAAKEIGDCIISGPATVKISTGNGAYAVPDKSSPAVFIRGSSGAQILFAADGKAVLNLGAGGGGGPYSGPFAVTVNENRLQVNSGSCLINLTEFFVEEATLSVPSSGFVVLESWFSGTAPETPQIKFASSRPKQELKKVAVVLASVSRDGDTLSVIQNQYGDIRAVMWSDCEEEENL